MAGRRDETPELRQRMRELYKQVGRPTYEVLRSHADRLGRTLPTSTTGDLLKGHRRPRWSTVETFVLACEEHARQRRVGISREALDLAAWQDLYDQALRPSGPVAVTSTIGSGIGGLRLEDPDAVDPDQVLEQARRRIQGDPSPGGYSLAGMMLAAAGLCREAVKYLLRSVQEDENQPAAWFNLGQAYVEIGETEKGSAALIRALRLRRDFARVLTGRESELPERVRNYLSGIEKRYQGLLEQRSSLMKKAIEDLKPSTAESADSLFIVAGYEVERGTNMSKFTIYLKPEGVAVTFCYPEELRDAGIIMPFYIPEGVDFAKQKSRFMGHFGYRVLEVEDEADESPTRMMFFAAQLKYERLSAEYLLRWILRSVLFQEAGEAFLENRPYWEVQIDDD